MPIKKQSGFTIVEVIISVGLTAMLIVVLAQIFFSGHRLYQTQNAELNVNYSARRALDEIDTYVKQATVVADSYSTYTTGVTELVLEVQGVNSTNQLIPGVFDTVIIYLSGDKIYREIVPGTGSTRIATTVLLAENVSELLFEYDNSSNALVRKITANISLIESTGRENQTLNVSTTSTLRN